MSLNYRVDTVPFLDGKVVLRKLDRSGNIDIQVCIDDEDVLKVAYEIIKNSKIEAKDLEQIEELLNKYN